MNTIAENLDNEKYWDEKVQEEIEYANNGWYTPGTSYFP